jgi:phosphoribosylamine---glycine ligase
LRVLLLGSGARTHALANRILVSDGEVWCIPMVELWQSDPRIHAGPADADLEEIAKWAVEAGIQLVVGMDEYSAFGDARACFEAQNLVYFGPSRAAAVLERSKLHTRRILEELGFEQPKLLGFITDCTDAAPPGSFPVVLKLDRSASARGVRLVKDPLEYAESFRALVDEHAASGADEPFTVLLEEFVSGFEVTFAVLAGKNDIVELPPVRDYKHFGEGDRGPLTSGMGGYSPVPSLAPGWKTFARELFTRVLDHMRRNGDEYAGYLNANVIYVDGRWVVLEFNCHMGDPDLELLLPQIDGDIALILHGLAVGSTVAQEIVRPTPSVAVSLVQPCYPASAERPGDVVLEPESHSDDVYLFTACRIRGRLSPLGGRVMLACATSPSFPEAVRKAYRAASAAHAANPRLVYRRDLGLEVME